MLVVVRMVAFFLVHANGLGAQMTSEKIPFGEYIGGVTRNGLYVCELLGS